MLNAEHTVKVGDKIRPIFIPSVSTSLTADRAHYYEGVYEVESVYQDYPYPLDGETEGFGTVAFITVNQNLNSTARSAFPVLPSMEGDRRYYVSHFEIVVTDPFEPVVELTEHEKEIIRLKEINRVQSDRITKLLEDVEHNSRVLTSNFFDLKEKHNWCSEANDTADKLNGEFRGGLSIEHEQEFEVEVEVVATLRTVRTVNVVASNLEEAQSMVMEDPSTYIEAYEITDDLNYNDWTDIEYELY